MTLLLAMIDEAVMTAARAMGTITTSMLTVASPTSSGLGVSSSSRLTAPPGKLLSGAWLFVFGLGPLPLIILLVRLGGLRL